MSRIQVCIFSHQILFHQGLAHSIFNVDDIEIVDATDITNELMSEIDVLPPDVALVDVDGPASNGLTMLRKIKQRLPTVGVIVLTSNPNDNQLFQVLKAQAAAYLGKDITAEHLINTIRSVAHGEHPINKCLSTNPNVASQVLKQLQELSLQSEAREFIRPLTSREIEILNYIAQGYPNKQIAIELGISEQTIKNHISSILRKLNATARTDAVVSAIKRGLISIN